MTTGRDTGRIWFRWVGTIRRWSGRRRPTPTRSSRPPQAAAPEMESSTVLNGTADDIGIASVFRLLASARRTGRLHVTRPAGTATVFFDRGRIYQARSDLVTTSLGERLIAMRVLASEELRRAMDRAATSGRPLDEVLETTSGVDRVALDEAVRQHMRESVVDVLSWEVGEFTWETGRVLAADVWIDLDVSELIAEPQELEHAVAPVGAPLPTRAAPGPRAAPPPPPPMTTPSTPAAVPGPPEIHLVEDEGDSETLATRSPGGLRLAPEPAAAPAQTFAIAFVCTGNRFRSPITEAIMKSRISDVPLTTVSVGRHDARPGPALPEAMEVARELGLDLSGHRARALMPRELKSFDLVLGFERAHVAEAIRLGAAPRDRAFTIMELADLLSEIGPIRATDPIERARLAVTRANDHRRLVRRYGTAVDLVDPIGQTIGAYRNSAAQIARLTDRLIAGLFGTATEDNRSPAPFWRGA